MTKMDQITIDEITNEDNSQDEIEREHQENKQKGRLYKEYNVSDINKHYLTAFQQSRYPNIDTDPKQRTSYNQYRCTINNFLESLSKDAAMTKRDDIDNFLTANNNSNNKKAHLKSFFIHMITANVKNCQTKVSRDLLIKLLEM